jgi:hypothetical protein
MGKDELVQDERQRKQRRSLKKGDKISWCLRFGPILDLLIKLSDVLCI